MSSQAAELLFTDYFAFEREVSELCEREDTEAVFGALGRVQAAWDEDAGDLDSLVTWGAWIERLQESLTDESRVALEAHGALRAMLVWLDRRISALNQVEDRDERDEEAVGVRERVLEFVSENAIVRPAQIIEALGTGPTQVSRALAELADRGQIERVHPPGETDGRVRHYALPGLTDLDATPARGARPAKPAKTAKREAAKRVAFDLLGGAIPRVALGATHAMQAPASPRTAAPAPQSSRPKPKAVGASYRRKPRSGGRAKRTAAKGRTLHVVKRPDGRWIEKAEGATRATGVYDTQAEAEAAARRRLENRSGGRIVLHRSDGRIRAVNRVAPAAETEELR